MPSRTKYTLVNLFIALVWLINGLLCKVLNLVPRHQLIVARILGQEHAATMTTLIGVSVTAIGIWVLCGIAKRLNVITQISIVAAMNMLEFILVPDLLLWGRVNAFFALLFISLIFYNEFYIREKILQL